MPFLILKFKDTIKGKYKIEKGKTISIGRKSDNEIVIDNLAVSGKHAKIDALDEGFLLTDLKSKNGTVVNGKLITSHWLDNGDKFSIAKHTVIFLMNNEEKQEADSAEQADETMVLDTEEHRSIISNLSSKKAAVAKKIGVLSFLKGKLEGEIPLNKKIIKIGKASSNDIVVGGFTTGKVAATISMRPNGYHLSYVDGMSKPKVNGESIKTSIRLKEFDIIEVGSAKMELIFKS